jgi:hypothetical protein
MGLLWRPVIRLLRNIMLCYVSIYIAPFPLVPSAQRRFFPVYQDVIHITVCLTSCFLKAIKKLCWRAAAIGRF